MLMQYDIRVRKTLNLHAEFSAIFGRTQVPYGRYRFFFRSHQLNRERLMTRLLRANRGSVTAQLTFAGE